jgi:hypothetical protein
MEECTTSRSTHGINICDIMTKNSVFEGSFTENVRVKQEHDHFSSPVAESGENLDFKLVKCEGYPPSQELGLEG